jgi:hypothetical protein
MFPKEPNLATTGANSAEEAASKIRFLKWDHLLAS